MTDRSVHLQQVANFRDVGRTVNDYLGQRRVREGVFFRSARLDDATSEDRKVIRQDIGIKTVIDLRTKTEHLRQAKQYQAKVTALRSNAVVAEPLQIPGLDYYGIKITGRPLERHILRQLSWWSFIFIILFIFGYRLPAIRIIGQEVMVQRGLMGLGLDTLDNSTAEIYETLCLYTSINSMPSIVHCTHGKDRTGLICALVLMILEVPVEAIEYDYFLTDAALQEGREERLAEIREIGLPDEWIGTTKDMITGIQEHLDTRYGGLQCYLDHLGFTKEQRVQLEEALQY